jgi:hypothetical protein
METHSQALNTNLNNFKNNGKKVGGIDKREDASGGGGTTCLLQFVNLES